MPDTPIRVRLARIRQTEPQVLQSPLRFQVGPLDELADDQPTNHEEYDTVRAGQFSRRASGRQLRRSEGWESFVLDWRAAWADPDADTSERILTELRGLASRGCPFDLLVTHAERVEIHYAATLRNNNKLLKYGEADTRYIQLDFVEWRPNEVRMKGKKGGSGGGFGGGGGGASGSGKRQKKLAGFDTLYSIAKWAYGSYAGWKDIAKANGLAGWGPNKPIIEKKGWGIGDIVKIPKRS